ncbi:YlmC/YmxH family sporulation protein [Pelosinus sp. sgz500959]|uniref:YlmC/YmxH family sporulation protein n=1 Tax=Pelosinus sp. sgz500959 TaxID=3242472 RepID=UPI00366E0555
MRLSRLSGKEVINLSDGSRLGTIDECELTFDHVSGRIHSILLPNQNSLMNFFGENRSMTIPWQGIKRIGDEIIIVDLNNDYEGYTKLHRMKQ